MSVHPLYLHPSEPPVGEAVLPPQSYRVTQLLHCLFVTFLIYLSFQCISNFWKNGKYHLLRAFPSPPTLPLLGNGHQMMFKPTEFYCWTENLLRKYGKGQDVVLTWRLNFPMLWISSYPITAELLSNPKFVDKSKDISLLYNLPGGNGLSGAPSGIHNPRRKLLIPGYSRKVVARSIVIFVEESQRLVTKLEKYSTSGKTFDILTSLMPCSFRVMCRAAFGDHLIKQRSDAEALEHMEAIRVIGHNFTERLMSPYLWLRNDWIYFNFTSAGKATNAAAHTINSFGQSAIEQLRENRKLSTSSNSESECYLDMLLDFEEKGDLLESDILGELNNFIVAGYDTTALGVAWTLFALAVHDPRHQELICAELDSIFGQVPPTQWNVTIDTVKQMKYLELCIKEALRMYPTSPVLPRSTSEPIKLQDGRIIPQDTDVYLMVNLIQMDPRYFPSPNEFQPERHLERNPAFIPFSTGTRRCVGETFAMHQIKVELAHLVKSFQWSTEERWETMPKLFQALLVPAEGIKFKISPR